MLDHIQVFKQNHVRVDIGDKVLHVDPFAVDGASHDADFILITHDHYDHFSPKEIEKVAGKNAVLIVPENMKKKAAEAAKFVKKTVTVAPGGSYNVDGLEFETVPAYNVGKLFHPKSAGWVGYILNVGGKRIYVAGDTDATPEARAVKCDIALVPIGGTYTMNAKQAQELVNTIRPEVAVPVHYGGIVGREEDGSVFAGAVDKDIKVVFKIKF